MEGVLFLCFFFLCSVTAVSRVRCRVVEPVPSERDRPASTSYPVGPPRAPDHHAPCEGGAPGRRDPSPTPASLSHVFYRSPPPRTRRDRCVMPRPRPTPLSAPHRPAPGPA